jgi:hypothetical protein
LRGQIDLHLILCDESSWFDLNQNQEVFDTIKGYAAKTNPITCLVSTSQRPRDLMDIIRQQPKNERFYKLMELLYKVGLGKIYTEQEIELQKKSLSFAREYDLSFESGIDAIFNAQDIEAAINDKYDTSDEACTLPSVTKWLGVDAGFSTSAFGLCIIQWKDNKLEVVYELEEKHADLDNMRKLIHSLIQKYHICRVFL